MKSRGDLLGSSAGGAFAIGHVNRHVNPTNARASPHRRFTGFNSDKGVRGRACEPACEPLEYQTSSSETQLNAGIRPGGRDTTRFAIDATRFAICD